MSAPPVSRSRRNYANGRAAEYRVRDALLAEGWRYVIRAAGSHGKADLVAIGAPPDADADVLLVQVKRGRNAKPSEREELGDLVCALESERLNVSAVIAIVRPRAGIEWVDPWEVPEP